MVESTTTEWWRDPHRKKLRYTLAYLNLAACNLRELGHPDRAQTVEEIRDEIDVEGIYKE